MGIQDHHIHRLRLVIQERRRRRCRSNMSDRSTVPGGKFLRQKTPCLSKKSLPIQGVYALRIGFPHTQHKSPKKPLGHIHMAFPWNHIFQRPVREDQILKREGTWTLNGSHGPYAFDAWWREQRGETSLGDSETHRIPGRNDDYQRNRKVSRDLSIRFHMLLFRGS